MAERKVLNKFFYPDYDPTYISRIQPWKERKVVVRMMLPMNVRCNKCKEYMDRGTKFNTRKEDVVGETYNGIRLYRFYFKCEGCSQPFCLKTDPENEDYICESGVTRIYDLRREEEKEKESYMKQKEEIGRGDAMTKLENRTKESQDERRQEEDELPSPPSQPITLTRTHLCTLSWDPKTKKMKKDKKKRKKKKKTADKSPSKKQKTEENKSGSAAPNAEVSSKKKLYPCGLSLLSNYDSDSDSD